MLVRMRSNRNFQSLLQLSSPEGPTWIFMGPYTPGNTRNVCQAEVPVFCFASRDGLQWRSGPGDTGRWWTDRDAPCPLLCCPRLLILSFWNCYINKHTVHNLGGLGFFFPLSIIFWTLSQVILMFFFHWWVSLVAQWSRICLPMLGMWVQSLVWEDPLEKGMATHSSILPGKFHGQRSLAGYSPWGHKRVEHLVT